MVFKLTKSAERHWRRLNGSEHLVEIARGVRFRHGEPVTAPALYSSMRVRRETGRE